MSIRLTEEMLENVIYENQEEINNFKPNNSYTNTTLVEAVCQVVRNMYFDCLFEYLNDIHDEDFYYQIPAKERTEIIEVINRSRKNTAMTKQTFDAIMALSVSSLEYLMIVEYEKEIDSGDCDTVIFNVKIK
jgi:hypothetical protein